MARYTFTLEVKWTDDQGGKHTYGPTTQSFPDDLTPMPLAVRRAFAEQMIIALVRVTLGISQWSDYE